MLKLYLAILDKRRTSLIIYIAIFMMILYMFSNNMENTAESFEPVKVRTAFFNEDKESVLIEGLYQYLDTYCEWVEVEEQDIEDALIIGEIAYSIFIEEGFSDRFIRGEEVEVIYQKNPLQQRTVTVHSALNSYLNAASILIEQSDGMDIEYIVTQLADSMSNQSQGSFFVEETVAIEHFYNNYFNYAGYILTACLILVIGGITTTINREEVMKRIRISPISRKIFHLKLLACNVLFVSLFVGLLIGMSIVMSPLKTVSANMGYYLINTLIFSVTILLISYTLAMCWGNKKVILTVSTVVSLIFAFFGGIFIPQEVLSEQALWLARFVPSYWYVLANNSIAKLTTLDDASVLLLVKYLAIQLSTGIGVMIFSIMYTRVGRKFYSSK